jgi:hypothetical protein
MKHKAWIGYLAAVVTMGLIVAGLLTPPAEAGISLFGEDIPTTVSAPDTNSVELGVRFSSDVAGQITAIRFYKSVENSGIHIGSLWTSRGRRVATVTFTSESTSGWQEAIFDQPVKIRPGRIYVASYSAPSGRYASDEYGFNTSYTRGHLTVPVGGGVYRSITGGFPDQTWRNSNYYVDVLFVPASNIATGPAESPSPGVSMPLQSPSPAVSMPSQSPSPAVSMPPQSPSPAVSMPPQSPSPAVSTTQPATEPASTSTTSPSATATNADLALPRVPWEGGPAYFGRFAQSKAFSNPNVFPIAAWWDDFSSDAEVKWDKDHGINTYVELNESEDGALLGKNGMHWIGDRPLKNMTLSDPAWVGYWLSDETDGRYDTTAGLEQLQREIDEQKSSYCPNTSCRFAYANFTSNVTSYYNDEHLAASKSYVNMYEGPVSVDRYYYTDPLCDNAGAIDYVVNAPDKSHCATAAAYGNLIKILRTRDAVDGKLKPLWGFVENGASNYDNAKYIEPEQMKGAAWNMVINEARGLVWFNQSFSGNCQAGNVIRAAQVDPNGCNRARVDALKQVSNEIQLYAPILNTQSYQWNFGRGVDSMLKVKDGYAYIFAMIGMNTDPGQRTFTLPTGIGGASVEVVGENRTISIESGRFTDTFAAEYEKHIYRVRL